MSGFCWKWVSLALVTCVVCARAGTAAPGKIVHEAYQWDNVEIVGGGFVSGILFHPKQRDLAYARTDIGGAYRWNPKTKRWIPLLDWIQRPDWNLYGVESIGLDPTDSKRLYLALGTYTNQWAGNGAIVRSTDQGRTFQRTDVPFKLGGNMDGRSIGERLAVDPNKNSILYFGSRGNGLWKSTDFGATWSQQTGFPITKQTNGIGICFEVFDTASGVSGSPTPTIYVGVSSKETNLYRSSDGGTTWAEVPGQPHGLIPQHAVIDPTGAMIITYGNAPGPNGVSAGAVWKLDKKQGVWTDISPSPGKGFGYAGLSLDQQHVGTFVVTTLDRWNPGDDVFRTIDGGAHWTGMKDSAQLDPTGSPFLKWGEKRPKFGWWMGTVSIDPFNSGHILFGTGATIWGCDDGTNVDRQEPTHWTPRAQGLEETAVIDLMSPPKGAHLFSGLGDIGGFRHDALKTVPPEGMLSNPLFNNTDSQDFAEANPDVMARVGRGSTGVRRGGFSVDGGMTWAPFATEPARSRGSGHVAVSADGAVILWTPSGGLASITRDHGVTWTPAANAPAGMIAVSDRVNAQRFYGRDPDSGHLLASADGGASFTVVGPGFPPGDGVLRAVPGVEGDLWLVAGGRLFHTTDGGTTFKHIESAANVSTIGFGRAAPGRKYPSLYVIADVAGLPGAFRSDDGGLSWICITDAKHGFGTMDQIIGDPRVFGRVYLGTNGRGVLFGEPLRG